MNRLTVDGGQAGAACMRIAGRRDRGDESNWVAVVAMYITDMQTRQQNQCYHRCHHFLGPFGSRVDACHHTYLRPLLVLLQQEAHE